MRERKRKFEKRHTSDSAGALCQIKRPMSAISDAHLVSIINDSKVSVVNRIYEASKLVYLPFLSRSSHQSLAAIESGPKIKRVMLIRNFVESISLNDLKIDQTTILHNYRACLDQHSQLQKGQRVSAFFSLFKSPLVSMALFFLPSNCYLETHNHPGMIVLSKVLCGSLKVRSFSPLGPPDFSNTEAPVDRFASFVYSTSLPDRVIDFGALPSINDADDEQVKHDYANLKIADNLSIMRRLVVGSRCKREIGNRFKCLELFHGVVDSSDSKQRSSSAFPLSLPLPSSFSISSLFPSPDNPTSFVCLPTIGNFHRLEPVSDFVLFLDVISPPYGYPSPRRCQYATVTPTSSCVSDTLYSSCGRTSYTETPSSLSDAVIIDDKLLGVDGFIDFQTTPAKSY